MAPKSVRGAVTAGMKFAIVLSLITGSSHTAILQTECTRSA
ncbi:hypothetical protein SNOG_15835 [Parastagonospora nodorum SN15]|uniref:Uncharacterized protein n=1 Tax=Phaeosphaeria nodorum (strain SN15 / ATCC MYA-4574 / FGSC 10173) TaxID=321614 RepID=Q0TX16_PHANO|nr:hypothetical protein SNOG_15835 [Parastagonospora nodorum SN15]EAT76673.1 hypothetical protein SNOG_15835 [Parastagonospora nodorum SN15]